MPPLSGTVRPVLVQLWLKPKLSLDQSTLLCDSAHSGTDTGIPCTPRLCLPIASYKLNGHPVQHPVNSFTYWLRDKRRTERRPSRRPWRNRRWGVVAPTGRQVAAIQRGCRCSSWVGCCHYGRSSQVFDTFYFSKVKPPCCFARFDTFSKLTPQRESFDTFYFYGQTSSVLIEKTKSVEQIQLLAARIWLDRAGSLAMFANSGLRSAAKCCESERLLKAGCGRPLVRSGATASI